MLQFTVIQTGKFADKPKFRFVLVDKLRLRR